VDRPDFKPGWGCQAVPGRFDSCSLPPEITEGCSVCGVGATVWPYRRTDVAASLAFSKFWGYCFQQRKGGLPLLPGSFGPFRPVGEEIKERVS
jgi:hypothetical protein